MYEGRVHVVAFEGETPNFLDEVRLGRWKAPSNAYKISSAFDGLPLGVVLTEQYPRGNKSRSVVVCTPDGKVIAPSKTLTFDSEVVSQHVVRAKACLVFTCRVGESLINMERYEVIRQEEDCVYLVCPTREVSGVDKVRRGAMANYIREVRRAYLGANPGRSPVYLAGTRPDKGQEQVA